MSQSASTKSPKRKSGRGIPLSYVVLGITGVIILACFVLVFGRVEGEEFSPEAFQRRQYHFFQIPFLKVQVGPVVRKTISNSLEDVVSKKTGGLSLNDNATQWDIATSSAYPRETYFGDAKILCDYLDLRNSDRQLVWEEWTDDHPEACDDFWSVIAAVAKARQYVLMPDLFFLAEAAESPEDLKRQTSQYVVEQSLKIGESQQATNRHEMAIIAFDLALQFDPQSAEILAKKKISEQALQE